MASAMNFLYKQVPSMDLARKILLNYSAQELIETYSHSHQDYTRGSSCNFRCGCKVV